MCVIFVTGTLSFSSLAIAAIHSSQSSFCIHIENVFVSTIHNSQTSSQLVSHIYIYIYIRTMCGKRSRKGQAVYSFWFSFDDVFYISAGDPNTFLFAWRLCPGEWNMDETYTHTWLHKPIERQRSYIIPDGILEEIKKHPKLGVKPETKQTFLAEAEYVYIRYMSVCTYSICR